MDTTKLITTLGNWKTAITNQILGLQDQKDVLDLAIQILTTGYQIDQVRIDTDIQTYQDTVAQQILDLQTTIIERDATIASLQAVSAPTEPIIP